MDRVAVYHLTQPRWLPLIEEEGLRTRAELSRRLGPPGPFDAAAPGRFAHGRRVSAYLDLAYAESQVARHGPGLVRFTVDPTRAVAVSGDEGDPAAYWAQARPLADWLAEGQVPDDLEVHVPVAVRAKHLRIMAPRCRAEELGEFAGLVAAVADRDRLSAKALMHLCLIASDGDASHPAFLAACALAWRDEPDPPDLLDELVVIGPDKVASTALAEFGAAAGPVADQLRALLDEVRGWGEQEGLRPGQALLARSGRALTACVSGDQPPSQQHQAGGHEQ